MEKTGHHIRLESFFNITSREVESRIGYTVDADISPRIASLIDEYIRQARTLIEPSYSYNILRIQDVDGHVVQIDGPLLLESQVISKVLNRCTQVAAFGVTIGSHLETRADELGDKGLILEAFILDTIGSCVTEKAVDFVQGIIGEMAHLQNLAISRRFSPGYCDWPLTEQKKLFRLFESNDLHVNLTDSCLMQPRKSISGLFGVKPLQAHASAAAFNPCSDCGRKDCSMRRTPDPV